MHINCNLACRCCRIHVQEEPLLVHKIAHLFYGLNGSNLAVGVHNRCEDRFLAEQALQGRQIDNAHAVHRNQGKVKAALLQILQGVKHRDEWRQRMTMDLNYAAEETAFARRGAQLAGPEPACRHPRQGHRLTAACPRTTSNAGTRILAAKGSVGAALAAVMGWHGLEHHAALHQPRRIRLGRRAHPAALRAEYVRVGAATLRLAEQQDRFLPRIRDGDDFWSAGLFRARRRAPTWPRLKIALNALVTTTSSTARRSGPRWATTTGDWIFCLVRTDTTAEKRREASASC